MLRLDKEVWPTPICRLIGHTHTQKKLKRPAVARVSAQWMDGGGVGGERGRGGGGGVGGACRMHHSGMIGTGRRTRDTWTTFGA